MTFVTKLMFFEPIEITPLLGLGVYFSQDLLPPAPEGWGKAIVSVCSRSKPYLHKILEVTTYSAPCFERS